MASSPPQKKSKQPGKSGDMDLSMNDATSEATAAAASNIRQKIQGLVGGVMARTASIKIEGSFQREELDTAQLKSLRDTPPSRVPVPGASGDSSCSSVGSDVPELDRYDCISNSNSPLFLDLACQPQVFYARAGYQELYDCVASRWDEHATKRRFRVILQGNAGTGKSWFQVYALKKLLSEGGQRKFDIVIRQVDSTIYVIDLAEATVYTWANQGVQEEVLLFLFYFWPWSYGETWSFVCDPNNDISVDLDEFQARFTKFGGILRHMLKEDENADEDLAGRLKDISLDALTSIALNIDREPMGHNVSGYLVCYDSRLVEQDRFSAKNLECTSLEVEEEVAKRLRTKPLRDKMQAVLNRLDGQTIDLSGKMLEDVAMELLSQGHSYAWQSCTVGTAAWHSFAMTKRAIKRTYTLSENFKQPDLVIAPANARFPVVDFLLSRPGNSSVVSFQCTWHVAESPPYHSSGSVRFAKQSHESPR